MKERKYRAWDKTNKKMWYSSDYGNSLGEFFRNHNRDDEIIMDYTGIKTNNGIEIYEGDIIEMEYADIIEGCDEKEKNISQVKWMKSGMFTLFPYDDGPGFIPTLGYFIEEADEEMDGKLKVIGNIYENPELIKESQ